MNILFTSDTYHIAVNGIVTHIATLKKELEKRGHKIVVVAPKYPGGKEEKDVLRLPSFSFPARPEDAIGNFLDKKTKKLLENMDFDQYVHRIFPGAEKPLKKPLDMLARSFFNKFDLVLSPSPITTQHLKEIKTKTKHLEIPNGINLKLFQNAKKDLFLKKFHIDPRRPVITIVGRLDQGKNVEMAIEAMEEVTKKMPQALLVIVGDGTTRKKCENLIKTLHLENKVKITGLVDQQMVASAHQASTLSLMLSKVDNLPTVAIEAAAASTPIIALNDPGMKVIVGHKENGLLVNPTKEEVAQAIILLLNDQKLLQKYGQKSAQVAQNFSVETYTDKLEALYRQLINSKKTTIG